MNRRRWLEVGAIAVPVLAGAVWLGVLVVGGDDGAPDPIAIEASGPSYATLDELVAASDVIVAAEVVDLAAGRTLSDPADPQAGIRTRLVDVEVTRTLRGEPSPTLVIEEEAGLLDGTPIVVNGVAPSARGDRGVYFLVAGETPDAPYHALVNEQGRYLVDGERLLAAGDDRLSTELAAMGLDALIAGIVAAG